MASFVVGDSFFLLWAHNQIFLDTSEDALGSVFEVFHGHWLLVASSSDDSAFIADVSDISTTKARC